MKRLDLSKVDQIIVHHTASPRSTTLAQVRRWHKARGFDDVGYHWFIDGKGRVQQGRSLRYRGAHCAGQNWRSVGIAVAGDFELVEPTEDQLTSLWALIEATRKQLPRDDVQVTGHRDHSDSVCPGDHLYDLLRERFGIPPVDGEDHG